MTKEERQKEICGKQTYKRPMPMVDVYAAMDIWGKEVAIGFKDWGDKYFLFNRGKYYQIISVNNDPPISYSSEQLFVLYLNHLNTIKDEQQVK